MLAHSQHIPRAETQPGDFAVFGLNPSQHVVVLTQSAAGGNGAMCVSHGRQGDPVQVPLTEEIVAQPITFLRLMPGGAVPPQGGPNPYCSLDVDGDFEPETIKALQWKLGADQDGDFGPDTIKALQRRVGVTQSGVWGAETTKGPAAHAEREHLLTGGGHGAGSRVGALKAPPVGFEPAHPAPEHDLAGPRQSEPKT